MNAPGTPNAEPVCPRATGLILSFATGYLGSELTYVAALALLLVVLLLRPSGLFAGALARRV